MEYIFDIPAFRVSFPAFADPTIYPDDMLQRYWDMTICYINDVDYGWLCGNARYLALTLMTAHLLTLAGLTADGQTPGLVQTATIDKVSVSLTPPPLKNQWQWWLSITPYGQQLFALLQVHAVGGLYIEGGAPRAGFRQGGGFC